MKKIKKIKTIKKNYNSLELFLKILMKANITNQLC